MIIGLSIFRPLNLFLLAATQLLAFLFLDNSPDIGHLFYPSVWLLITGTLMTTAAGYLVNDFFDMDRDTINKPEKVVIGFWIKKRLLWPAYTLLNLVALLCSFLISVQLLLLFGTFIVLLFLYSWKWKDLPLLGNLLIAFLVAVSLLVVRHVNPNINTKLLMFYAMFAFFINWLREMIKDMEDFYGDKQFGAHTLAVLLGMTRSKYFVTGLTIFILALLFSSWSMFKEFLPTPELWVFDVYYILCLMVPLLWMLSEPNLLNRQPDYHLMSQICKYVMATGVASMMFF
jgi:4-hydroxybenzoate polyprenyltransferase